MATCNWYIKGIVHEKFAQKKILWNLVMNPIYRTFKSMEKIIILKDLLWLFILFSQDLWVHLTKHLCFSTKSIACFWWKLSIVSQQTFAFSRKSIVFSENLCIHSQMFPFSRKSMNSSVKLALSLKTFALSCKSIEFYWESLHSPAKYCKNTAFSNTLCFLTKTLYPC